MWQDLFPSKERICRSLGTTKEQLLPKLLSAIEHPVPPQMVQTAACQEVVETNVDLTKLPIMHYTEKDGGKYIASAVSIVKDPELGRNMCFHRLMLLDKNHFVARIVEHRGTDTALKKAGGELDIAICIGNSTATLLAAATTLPMGVDELGMANALEKTDLVKCKTVDLEVPADCEFVLGRKNNQRESRRRTVSGFNRYCGPCPPATRRGNQMHNSPQRTQFTKQSSQAKTNTSSSWACQKNPPSTTKLTKSANAKTSTLRLADAAGSTRLCKLKKQNADDGKKAIAAAFEGHKSLKHCVVVDEDINIYDPHDVEWAIATRFQADKNTIILSNQPGSSLDPSGDLSEGKKATTAKAGLDATAPLSNHGQGLQERRVRKS